VHGPASYCKLNNERPGNWLKNTKHQSLSASEKALLGYQTSEEPPVNQ
jgi:hypothetical protein